MNFKELQQDLFEANKVMQDLSGIFAKIMLKDGNNVIAFYGKGKTVYVINASISNLRKFKDWAGRDAIVDIQKTGKKVRLATGKKVPTIRLRVEMKTDDDENDGDKKELEKSNGDELTI